MNERSGKFLLSKWYLDCVTEDGETFIGYSARLLWHNVSLQFSSLFTHTTQSGPRTRSTLLAARPPQNHAGTIQWEVPRIGVSGSWEALCVPVERTLYEDTAGTILWSCYQPASRAEITLDGDRRLRGDGYAECIEMTVEPWILGMDELRWGRFVSGSESVVWIDLRGSTAIREVFHNSAKIPGCTVTDSELSFGGGTSRLTLGDTVALRDERLVSGALSMIPGLGSFVPEGVLNARETKWRSRGKLERTDRPELAGWVIHELVKFS